VLGLGNLCNNEDPNLFSRATMITIGDGKTIKLWNDPWIVRES
jgi:hypothetical protein